MTELFPKGTFFLFFFKNQSQYFGFAQQPFFAALRSDCDLLFSKRKKKAKKLWALALGYRN